jgi:outer membrane protein assembly factor BamB
MLTKGKEQLSGEPAKRKPLRLWPGVVIVLLQWLLRFGLLKVMPEAVLYGVLGGIIGGIAIIMWWLFFSRAPRLERWGAVVLITVALSGTFLLLHVSMRLMPFIAYIIPVLSLAFVIWAVVSHRLSHRIRRVAMVATILLACGGWTLFQTSGVTGEFHSNFMWRWAKTHEDRFLAQIPEEPKLLPSTYTAVEPDNTWPGFRGIHRDGIIHGVQIETDWFASPPVEMWRRAIGPGWSSFAVSGNLLYTQEQRGDNEIVSCYKVSSGEPVWIHQDATRFWESNSGAGPRGTPTLNKEWVYALGATGILKVLNAADGDLVWSRNAAEDTDTKVPTWGFSSSPLVVDDLVIVALAGSLIAYDLTTGEPRWINPAGGDCYSSPHLLDINGVTQILLQNETGTSSVTPVDGKLLWNHFWAGHPIVQPILIEGGDILLSADERSGIRRIVITNGPGGWTTEEQWTSGGLKPYFNDSVIHNGNVFGFDGPKLSCIYLSDGTRKWKGGRYGRGQLLLLADQDLLLILSEKGDLALVKAMSDQFAEVARFPAIKGKTWNHPVLLGDVLLVRNSQEMAAFRLNLLGS